MYDEHLYVVLTTRATSRVALKPRGGFRVRAPLPCLHAGALSVSDSGVVKLGLCALYEGRISFISV